MRPEQNERRQEFFRAIAAELDHAYAKHGTQQWGRHEFYGILKEEVDELWANIKSDAPQDDVEDELLQVAAMCLRYYETRDRYRAPAASEATHLTINIAQVPEGVSGSELIKAIHRELRKSLPRLESLKLNL